MGPIRIPLGPIYQQMTTSATGRKLFDNTVFDMAFLIIYIISSLRSELR